MHLERPGQKPFPLLPDYPLPFTREVQLGLNSQPTRSLHNPGDPSQGAAHIPTCTAWFQHSCWLPWEEDAGGPSKALEWPKNGWSPWPSWIRMLTLLPPLPFSSPVALSLPVDFLTSYPK